jgi:hypothetical protein
MAAHSLLSPTDARVYIASKVLDLAQHIEELLHGCSGIRVRIDYFAMLSFER